MVRVNRCNRAPCPCHACTPSSLWASQSKHAQQIQPTSHDSTDSPSLNSPAMTTEDALLIKFMHEQARAKFATGEPTYAIHPGLLLSIQWLKTSLFSKASQLSLRSSTPTPHTTTPPLFLDQPPPLRHRRTGTSKNRRQAVRASSHPTEWWRGRLEGGMVLGAGGGMSTKTK